MLNITPILKLPTNTTGKDFVVGDLHGCYDLLESLLGAVSFDKSKDRLFSVGDLIDRGPNSLRCLRIPFQSCRRFRCKAATPSKRTLPPIPVNIATSWR